MPCLVPRRTRCATRLRAASAAARATSSRSRPCCAPREPRDPAPAAEMTMLKTVGKSERRVDSVKLATGRGTFVDDIELPGMLHARILHSPHAHARIKRIDAGQGRALPGVACVLTHEHV